MQSMELNDDGELVVTYADGSELNLGVIPFDHVLKFTLLENGTYGVEQGEGALSRKTITIPSTYKGKAVAKIMDHGFENLPNLEEISIPESVTAIGEYAFYMCESLVVNLPESVTVIGRYAFYKCKTLTFTNVTDDDKWKREDQLPFEFKTTNNVSVNFSALPGKATKMLSMGNLSASVYYTFTITKWGLISGLMGNTVTASNTQYHSSADYTYTHTIKHDKIYEYNLVKVE